MGARAGEKESNASETLLGHLKRNLLQRWLLVIHVLLQPRTCPWECERGGLLADLIIEEGVA